MADLDDRTQDVSIHDDDTDQAVNTTVTPDGKRRLDGAVVLKDATEERFAVVTAGGRLAVTAEIPPIIGSNPVTVVEYANMAGTIDNVYVIPNGETLVLQRLSASASGDNNGSAVELWHDPNGNGVGMTIIDVIHVNSSSGQDDLSAHYVGNGTRAIRLRRKRYGGGSVDLFGKWEGYY